jgi:hypothetical protein
VKRWFVWLGLLALALGGAVLAYRGPGRAIVRGHVGDVAATMLVYAALGLVWSARARWRAGATLVIAGTIELGQVWWHATSIVGTLVAGSTFDPVDFVAYGLGVVIAVTWELAARRRSDTLVGCASG